MAIGVASQLLGWLFCGDWAIRECLVLSLGFWVVVVKYFLLISWNIQESINVDCRDCEV